ncbi:MAG: EAL domain-containing protein [Gammaproteobacteria bacterium]|nr:EAL domain-containing protein [Gammaproteobacteria bacterium]
MKTALLRLSAARPPSTAFWLILSILAATVVLTFHVHDTLSSIERALPLKVLEQRRDVTDLEQHVSELNNAVESMDAGAPNFGHILEKVDALDRRLQRIRGTYKLDNLMGAASLHAVIAPMLTDVRNWLTDGVHGYQLSDLQVLLLVRTRVSDAHARIQDLVDDADRLAFSALEGEAAKISSFRIQMTAVFVVLFLAAAALVYYITRRNIAQRALDEERQRAQLALDAANLYDWAWDIPSDRLSWGRDPARLLGPAGEDGRYPNFPDLVHAEDREFFLQAGRSALLAGDDYKVEFRIHRTDGAVRWLEAQGRRTTGKDGDPERMIGVTQDITERKSAEQEIHRYAYFDSLTELPNRQQLVKRLDAAVQQAVQMNRMGALLFMDLDHFKNINDSLGHAVGDRVLKDIAERIGEVVRSTDLVGRLGGDEFTVLLPNLSSNSREVRSLARRIGEKIQQKLALPYRVDGHELHVSVSIGISVFPLKGCPVECMAGEILKNADTAMYRAKEAGRHAIKFFVSSMRQTANRKLVLQRTIQQALDRDQMRFDFQPQVDQFGKVTGIEALLRLDSPDLPGCETSEIIDVAEESGLMLPLGDRIIVRACRHLKNWTECGIDFGRLAVNVSLRQFHHHDFVDRVSQVLSDTGADPARLEMEITEGTIMVHVENVIDKMHALKQLGIQFTIDDFGTGYSSLAYLKKLPLDRIKIDRSFTKDLVSEPNDAVIVETIVSMARSLDLEVVAEGVETLDVLEALRVRSCTVFQGHFFGPPMDEQGLMDILRRGSMKPAARGDGIKKAKRSIV